MARVDKLAVWIAEGLLGAQGVSRTPGAMGAMMPIAYLLSDAAFEAIEEIVAAVAAELAGRPLGSVPDIGDVVAALEWRQWESEFASSGRPGNDPQGDV